MIVEMFADGSGYSQYPHWRPFFVPHIIESARCTPLNHSELAMPRFLSKHLLFGKVHKTQYFPSQLPKDSFNTTQKKSLGI